LCTCYSPDHSTNGNSFILTNDSTPPAGTVTSIYSEDGDLQYNVSGSGEMIWRVAGTQEMSMNSSTLELSAGNNLKINGTGATGFIDIDEITTPAGPAANIVRIYAADVSGDTHLFQDNSTESPIDLTTGSEVTTWTANHNAAGFNLLNVGEIQINNPADTFQYIITPAAITGDRTLNLPLMTETDTLVLNTFAATLANKSIDLGTNTLTGSIAEFNTALQSATFAFIGTANAWGAVDQNIAATGAWQEGGVDISPIGIHDIWIGAVGMWPATTAGCAALAQTELPTNDVDIQTLDFATGADEFAQFTVTLPRNFDNATMTFTAYWTAASGSGTVQWSMAVLARSNDDPLDAAFTDETAATADTLLTANDLHIAPTSANLTITGMVDSDLLQCRIRRDVSGDTLGVDAKLIGVMLHITTDAATSA